MPENPYQLLDLIKLYRARWPDLKPTNVQLLDELDFINDSLAVNEDSIWLQPRRPGVCIAAGGAFQVWLCMSGSQRR